MISKKNLWFLTLFSLILILSIYYITMPSELLLTTNTEVNESVTEPTVNVEENSILVALRVEADEQMNKEIEELELVLTNTEKTTDEKNEAYEKIKQLKNGRSEEEKLESQIKEQYKYNSFIKIKGNQINVVIQNTEHSTQIANNIIRTIQSNYEEAKYITVKFQE